MDIGSQIPNSGLHRLIEQLSNQYVSFCLLLPGHCAFLSSPSYWSLLASLAIFYLQRQLVYFLVKRYRRLFG